MVSKIDVQRFAQMLPQGVKPGTDLNGLTVGVVTGLNIPDGQVQVVVAGSDPVWVPAAPFIYQQGARVRLRRNPLDGGRIEYCEGPIDVAPLFVTGIVTAVGSTSLTVTVLDGSYVLRPFAAGTYDVDDEVWVLRHPSGFGVPQGVLGLAGESAGGSNPGGGQGNPGQVQSRQATISPQDSGSYRSAFSRWDSWNTNRYGGVKALWQGNAYGSGPMVGWAGYGDQVENLHAVSIQNMWVDVTRSDSSVSAARSVVLIGSPDGTRPADGPTGTGATVASPGLTPGQSARLRLPDSTYEAWRTGALKGLATVGSDYLAVYGADRSGAMALTIQYRVVV